MLHSDMFRLVPGTPKNASLRLPGWGGNENVGGLDVGSGRRRPSGASGFCRGRGRLGTSVEARTHAQPQRVLTPSGKC